MAKENRATREKSESVILWIEPNKQNMQIKPSPRALYGDTDLKLLKFSGPGYDQCKTLTVRNMGTSQCTAPQRPSVANMLIHTTLETTRENKNMML